MIKEKILNIRNNHAQNLDTLARYIRNNRLLGFCVKWNVLAIQQIRNHIVFSGTQNEQQGLFFMNFNRTLLFQYNEGDVVHVQEIENESFKKDLGEVYADLKYLNLLSENDCDKVYEDIGSIYPVEVEACKLYISELKNISQNTKVGIEDLQEAQPFHDLVKASIHSLDVTCVVEE